MMAKYVIMLHCPIADEQGKTAEASEDWSEAERGMLRALSDSGIFFSNFIPTYIILSALFSDPSTIMLKLL